MNQVDFCYDDVDARKTNDDFFTFSWVKQSDFRILKPAVLNPSCPNPG